jgi:hypothetical protein
LSLFPSERAAILPQRVCRSLPIIQGENKHRPTRQKVKHPGQVDLPFALACWR